MRRSCEAFPWDRPSDGAPALLASPGAPVERVRPRRQDPLDIDDLKVGSAGVLARHRRFLVGPEGGLGGSGDPAPFLVMSGPGHERESARSGAKRLSWYPESRYFNLSRPWEGVVSPVIRCRGDGRAERRVPLIGRADLSSLSGCSVGRNEQESVSSLFQKHVLKHNVIHCGVAVTAIRRHCGGRTSSVAAPSARSFTAGGDWTAHDVRPFGYL